MKAPDRRAAARKSAAEAQRASRTVHIRGEATQVPVVAREALGADTRIDGPVIVEERETTIFVLPGWQLTMHETGSLVATRMKG